jgi:hypothetical protein
MTGTTAFDKYYPVNPVPATSVSRESVDNLAYRFTTAILHPDRPYEAIANWERLFEKLKAEQWQVTLADKLVTEHHYRRDEMAARMLVEAAATPNKPTTKVKVVRAFVQGLILHPTAATYEDRVQYAQAAYGVIGEDFSRHPAHYQGMEAGLAKEICGIPGLDLDHPRTYQRGVVPDLGELAVFNTSAPGKP